MICPKCGENNPDNYRFCGVCGAVLQEPKSATTPKTEPSWAQVTSARKAASGPSLSGIGQPTPTLDSLRGDAFPEPRFHIEEPRKRGRTVVLLLILAVVAVGVWRRYHFTGSGKENAKPQTTDTSAGSAGDAGQERTPAQPETANPPANVPSVAPAQPVSPPPATAAENPTNNTAANSESKPPEQAALAPATPPVEKTVVSPKKAAAAHKKSPVQKVSVKARPAKAPPADDSGEAALRKGEAYLYGRGARQNCDEAMKNLKAAAAKNNAKARSTLGTIYATGHCVSRDLPTAYSWFAAALRADPSNNVLEKDLSALWNQMTPPERQLAIKKQ